MVSKDCLFKVSEKIPVVSEIQEIVPCNFPDQLKTVPLFLKLSFGVFETINIVRNVSKKCTIK